MGTYGVTRPFQQKARGKTALGQERTVTIPTVPLNLTVDNASGKSRVVLSFIILPGQRHLFFLGQKMLGGELFSDVVRFEVEGQVALWIWNKIKVCVGEL